MEGMLGRDGAGMYARIITVAEDGIPAEWSHKPPEGISRIITAWGTPGWAADVWGSAIPDLSDPATLGCLVVLAREALGEPGAYAAHYDGSWTIERDDGAESEGYHDGGEWGLNGSGDFISEPSEPAVWVAALEAAGRKAP
jgi:hypothetical protein